MAKITDKIALYLSAAVLFYVAGAYITDSYLWGLAFALPLSVLTVLVTRAMARGKSGVTYGEWVRILLVEGKECSDGYLHALYPLEQQTAEHEYIAADGRYIVNALGFGKAGEEWAANIYRRLKGNRYRMVIAAVDVDRKALGILSPVAAEIKVLHPKEMLRKLNKQNVPIARTPPRTRLNWRTRLSTLSLRHAGLLALSAAGCLLMSIWLPFKAYYYTFAAIDAALCIGILFIKKRVKE